MATGRSNKLVGQIGEFLVCAELGRLGLIATPFAGNVPGFDVIATDEHYNSVPIQVKANNGGSTWQFNGDKYLDIDYDPKTKKQTIGGLKKIADPNLIFVFVWLGHRKKSPDRYFVLTKRELQQVMRDHYEKYLRDHDGQRPQNPESRFIAIRLPELAPYENRWKMAENALRAKG